MENKANIKAIILAAGKGTRLRPYTLDKPKCLVEVDGKSLIDRQLAIISTANIHPILMIGGYKAGMLKRPGVTVRLNPRYAETNMVWTLFSAEADLEGDVLISYGDIVYSKDILLEIIDSDADIAVAIDLEWESYWRARNENPLDDAETLKLHSDGRIYEIGQKPHSLQDIEGQYMGLIKLSSHGVEVLKKVFSDAKQGSGLLGKPVEQAYMTDLLQAVIDAGYPVQSVPTTSAWVEVDTVSDLKSETTKSRLAQIESST
ncbi:MAG: phosphocholine cytidylyltransferase family protein [Methylophaga sp.]